MKKALLRTGAIGALLLLLIITIAWLTLRASLPQLDGQIATAGLIDSASIARDAYGIPLITASNRPDLAFATGFAHGQDRFFQMDLIRRQAAGELSALVGEAALSVDKRFRWHRFRHRANAVLAAASQDERQLLQAYTDGVNAGLASLSARPFEYFVLGETPQAWSAEDSILVVYAMFSDLNDSRASNEVRRGRARSALPAELYDWIYPEGTAWDSPIVGEARAALQIPSAQVVSLRGVADSAPPADEQGRAPLRGSNNWAVSGALTTTGRAMLSNDMHLGLSVPNIYYRARLVVNGPQGVDLTGVTLPGAPFVVAGSNTHMAWGYTNSYGDYTDAVVLVPGVADGTYLTPDGERGFDVHVETIHVKDGESIEYPIRETVWGPVLDDVDYPDGEIAVSWIAHDPAAVNLNIIKLETATSASAALDIANTMGMPPQNFVTADAGGNIGWTIAGKIPRKSEFAAMLPADWSQTQGWLGWLPAAEYPRVYNPPSGRIWTANSRVVDNEALALIGDGGYDHGARARQIRDGLFARDTFETGDMLKIQTDDRALFLARWREVALQVLTDEVVADDTRLAEYRRLIDGWIPRATAESVGYRLVRAFHLEVEKRFFYALTTPVRDAFGEDVRLRKSNQFEAALWSAIRERPMHLLPGDYNSWDEFLLAAIAENVRYFDERFDGPLAERTWGERNTAQIRHPLSSSLGPLGQYLDMPAEPLDGDLDMPRAQGPGFGASERFTVSPGDEANALMQMPTGASGHPLSAFYDMGHDDWVSGRDSPFLPGVAQHTLTLQPDRR